MNTSHSVKFNTLRMLLFIKEQIMSRKSGCFMHKMKIKETKNTKKTIKKRKKKKDEILVFELAIK